MCRHTLTTANISGLAQQGPSRLLLAPTLKQTRQRTVRPIPPIRTARLALVLAAALARVPAPGRLAPHRLVQVVVPLAQLPSNPNRETDVKPQQPLVLVSPATTRLGTGTRRGWGALLRRLVQQLVLNAQLEELAKAPVRVCLATPRVVTT